MVRLLCYVILALAVGACSNSGDVELTLVNQNVALNTEIASVRSTATYAADALDITVEYVGTAMQQVTQQYGVLSLTMAAAGLNPAAVTPGAPVIVPTQPVPVEPIQSSNGTPLPTLQDVSGGSSDTAITPSVPADPSLYNIVTAAAVGANDCAISSVSTFSISTAEIYVVATAANIAPGTTLSSSWLAPDGVAVNHSFTPDFTIDQNCIWFYIDQSDVVFTPGSWSVQLAINNQPVGQPVAFTITE
jgi:hypothetical protein